MAKRVMMMMLVVAALLVSSHATANFGAPRRSLSQAAFNPTCTQARGLSGRCMELFNCITTDAKSTPVQRAQFRTMRSTIMNICNSCITATRTCPAGNRLPTACAAGLRFPAVSRCIQTALTAQRG